MMNKIIGKLVKKNKLKTLEKFLLILSVFRINLSKNSFRHATNTLGEERFRKLFSHIKLNKEQQLQLLAFNQNETLLTDNSLTIAVCLSGNIRSFSHCKKQLERFFSGYNVTYFCHAWQKDVQNNELIDLDNSYTIIEESPDFTFLEKLSIQAFGFKNFGDKLKVPFMSPNIFPMWYGVKRAFQSIEDHGFKAQNFDLICRCRYDNYFLGQLAQLQYIPNKKDIFLDSNYDGYGGYGDQFAVGAPAEMEKYCTLFDWLPISFELYRGDQKFYPEVIIRRYLENSCSLNVKQLDFGLRLLRDEFVGLEGFKIPLRSHSVSKARNLFVSEYIKNKFPDLYSEID